MSGAVGRRCARWRAGVVVSALGIAAVAGALPSVAAPVPATSAAAVASVPAAPADFTPVKRPQKISFFFKVPAGSTGPAITGYEISIDNGATWKPVATTIGLSFPGGPIEYPDGSIRRDGEVSGLRDDVAYVVALRATFAGGVGAATASIPLPSYFRGIPRLAGPDRVATAITASEVSFNVPGSVPAAVVTTSATYADALAGAALAAKVGGPLLLTSPTTFEPAVAREIRRVVKAGGTIYVLGDAGAVSADVEAQLRPAFTVTRLAGADRYATALAVANQMRALGATGPAYLATGANYPDGLTVSTLAGHTDGVVVLAGVNEYALPALDAATREWIERDDPTGARTVPVGGPAAAASGFGLPDAIRARAIIGVDRYDTSRRVADAYGVFTDDPAERNVGLATGENWPDALVGAAFMGRLDGPLLLTDGTAAQLNPFTVQAIADLTRSGIPASGFVFGGSDVLSDALVNQFDTLVPEQEF